MAVEPLRLVQLPLPAVADRSVAELEDELTPLGVPRFRARQIFRAVHHRHVRTWEQITDLPASLRAQLAERYRLEALELQLRQRSSDGTEKLLLTAWDGQEVETVHIPAVPAEERRAAARSGTPITETRRLTVCVSSQAGCALACQFCATGQMGFARDLTPGEIVEQIYRAEEPDQPRRVDNVVFMGMGEPMANYERVVAAIRLLADPLGYGFSPRRVTVSTSGLVPEMYRLAEEGLEVRLAVSLHAPVDALRSRLMPINRRYPVEEVLRAAAHYAERSGRRVSYEYVMLNGVNDADAHAEQLARLLHGQDAHVNLIPYNQTASGFVSSPPERIRAFARLLRARGLPCTVRASRGEDIAAACGQLKAENQRIERAQEARAGRTLRG
jgi:23S rRNA (adenine2503-C2)-methyltransferase